VQGHRGARFALPDFARLERTFRDIAGSLSGDVQVKLSDGDREKLIRSAQGLTLRNSPMCWPRRWSPPGASIAGAIDVVNTEKKQIIRKSGVLEFYPASESLKNVGGLDRLKDWLIARGQAFGDRARTFGLPGRRAS